MDKHDKGPVIAICAFFICMAVVITVNIIADTYVETLQCTEKTNE